MGLPPGIPFEDYRRDVAQLTEAERALQREFEGWFPPVVIDAHVHNALLDHVLSVPERSLRHMASSFPWRTVEESRRLHPVLFPGAEVRCLRFAHAHPGIDHPAVNRWLSATLEGSRDRFAVFGLQCDPTWTLAEIARFRPAALKMYYMVTEPPGTTITEVFPSGVLRECERRHIPIILHLPRQITESVAEVCEVADRFADLPIVLAHLGVPNFMRPGLEDAYRRVARRRNIYMDTACMEYADIAELAIRVLGSDRIIFGTDDPISLLRVNPYWHPTKGPRVVPPAPMHWTDPAEFREFGHLGGGALMNHWQQLVALRAAFRRFGETELAIRQQVMYDNAARLYGFN